MLDHTQIRKGVRIIVEGRPYEVLESMPLKKAQRRVVIQSKIKNLLNGKVFECNFHQGDLFEEAELVKFQAKFLYSHRNKFVFCRGNEPAERFELDRERIGSAVKFLKPNQLVEAIIFREKIINVSLPIKISLKVVQAPPGLKGDSAQAGNKIVTLETGSQILAPLFIKEGDFLEINTEKEEYVRRLEKK